MKADPVILTNAHIIPMTGETVQADCLLLRGGIIELIGTKREVEHHVGQEFRRIDLRGKTVIPGFNDNHIHTMIMGDRLTSISLKGLSAPEIIGTLKERFGRPEPDTVMYGFGWDYPTVPEPHKNLLDAEFPDNPVYLVQFSGHGAWANSAMMERMGIRKKRSIWQGPGIGEVVTDGNGEPTGILRETMRNPFVQSILQKRWMTPVLIEQSLRAALEILARIGITTVQDNTWFPRTIPVLRKLLSREELTCRFSCWKYGMVPFLGVWMALMRHDKAWFHRGPWKFIADGAFSSHNAWLSAPYDDEPANSGAGIDAEKLAAMFRPIVAFGLQPACHAIGDKAVTAVCDAAEKLAARYPRLPGLRLRIEHMQLVRDEDYSRMRRLGILAAVQPSALSSPEKDIKLLGRERAGKAYPYKTLLDAGIPLSFGSDYPGEDIYDPLEVIHLAVNREGPERVSVEEAFRAYTAGSAYAEGRESEKGTIAAGKAADLAVLSENPFSVRPERIRALRVLMTVSGGRIVYSDPGLQE